MASVVRYACAGQQLCYAPFTSEIVLGTIWTAIGKQRQFYYSAIENNKAKFEKVSLIFVKAVGILITSKGFRMEMEYEYKKFESSLFLPEPPFCLSTMKTFSLFVLKCACVSHDIAMNEDNNNNDVKNHYKKVSLYNPFVFVSFDLLWLHCLFLPSLKFGCL